MTSNLFDVIVVGAGHAGVEAAWAAARLGRSVGVCTPSDGTIAHHAGNPAVGGTAKGHLVRRLMRSEDCKGCCLEPYRMFTSRAECAASTTFAVRQI